MPFWWVRKCHQKNNNNKEEENHHSYNKAAAIKHEKKKGIDKPKSFDEVFPRNSPRNSKDFFASAPAGAASGVVGCYNSVFDSDGGGVIMEKRGHPLPRPSVSSAPSLVIDLGVGLGSGSVSVSSVSSSGSSDDPPDHGLFGGYRAYGETKFNPRSRSPGPGSRGVTASTSPLHPRLSGLSLESPTGKQEDGKSPCHPLPLPPGSPTNPCTSPTFRTSGANENSQSLQSKWKKGRLLGRGTFGHVYFGFNSDSGQMCAIKEVRIISDDQSSKECLNQLNQEITLLSQLLHPNIVQYYGSELGEETLSVYLEFVSGGSIHKLLQEYGPFKEPVIQNYTRQILSGLNYLHGRNTVHRDIKGANILVDPNGGIKLADFGMAKHITSYSSMLSFKGSPYWMAPEVIMNTSGYSLAVDIWSLGCTVLEMATSKPPWGQYEGVAAIFKIGNSRDIPEIPDHLSNDAKNFLRLCLQRDPSARPTAAQLLNHPFVRDQAAVKVPKINIINDTYPSTFDGNYTQIASDFHSNKTNVASRDVDYGMKTTLTSSEPSRSPRRRNMSLPVSPCSSPLRHYTPAYKSCLVSPPHPAYTLLGSSYYGLNDYPVLSPRPNTNYPADPWLDINQLKAQTPGGSPRSRYI